MPNKFVFADEAGCFTFKKQKGASKYFILCTLTSDDGSLSHDLLELRRNLCLAGEPERDKLHATTDKQAVRDRVFEILSTREASIGTKKTRATFKQSVNNTLQQTVARDKWEVCFIESSKDPLLWAADYCAWALQRKWETGDERSYVLIHERVRTQFDLWRTGTTHYY